MPLASHPQPGSLHPSLSLQRTPAAAVGPGLQGELPGLLLVVARNQRVRLANGKGQVGLHGGARQQDAALAHITVMQRQGGVKGH